MIMDKLVNVLAFVGLAALSIVFITAAVFVWDIVRVWINKVSNYVSAGTLKKVIAEKEDDIVALRILLKQKNQEIESLKMNHAPFRGRG